MTWITENKGAGPWEFEPQGEKCGYVNNPRWTANPADDDIHAPCGYWPKGQTTNIDVNIYGLFTSGTDAMWGVHFDGTTLRYLGKYEPAGPVSGLEWYGSDLLLVQGQGSAAKLLQVSGAPPFALIAETTPLNANDLPSLTHTNILYVPALQRYYIIGPGWTSGGRLLRLGPTLTRQARGIYATVTTGTDGNLYYCGTWLGWNEGRHPISGEFWDPNYWTNIPDNLCDSPLQSWGSGTAIPTEDGTSTHAIYHDGYLYLSNYTGSASGLRKLDPTTMEIVATASGGSGLQHRFVAHEDRIYALAGIMTANVEKRDASTLATISNTTLTHGRTVSNFSDILMIGQSLYVITSPYVADAALYRLNKNTLAVELFTLLGPLSLYQTLTRLNDNFLVAGHNTGVSIFELQGLTMVADLAVPSAGWNTHRILVRDNSATTASPARCGTSPVWPMTA